MFVYYQERRQVTNAGGQRPASQRGTFASPGFRGGAPAGSVGRSRGEGVRGRNPLKLLDAQRMQHIFLSSLISHTGESSQCRIQGVGDGGRPPRYPHFASISGTTCDKSKLTCPPQPT